MAALRVSESTLRKYVRKGLLHPVLISGRLTYDRSQLQYLIERGLRDRGEGINNRKPRQSFKPKKPSVEVTPTAEARVS